MATTAEELSYLVSSGKTEEVADLVVGKINDVIEAYRNISDITDRLAASGLAAQVIQTTEKLENSPPFIVELGKSSRAIIYNEDGLKVQDDVHEFIADRASNLDDRLLQFEYGKGEQRQHIRAFGLGCVARVIEYPETSL
jgi:hypothetical protein